ncbi:MAG TPA: hypothetical protein V6D48_18750 [Oculatellaceae cyanobacterium]
MKLKLVPMLIGVLAVATITTTPLAAFAQAQSPQPQQAEPPRPRINLSAEQQAEFEKLQASTVSQIEAKLNPEQKKQYADARASGGGLIQSLGAIKNVSEIQKSEIVEILQNFNSKIGNLLTEDQKKLIEQSQSQQ